jgi:hypothetical protein
MVEHRFSFRTGVFNLFGARAVLAKTHGPIISKDYIFGNTV